MRGTDVNNMSTPFKHLPRVRSMPAPLSRAVQYPSPFHRTLRHQSSGQVQQFLDAVKSRRTYYELGRDAPVDHRTIFETLKTAILHCPSSFNSQTARLVVLFNSHHERLWQITSEVLEAVVPPENFEPTAKKIEGLRSGYGTVSTCLLSCQSRVTFYIAFPRKPKYSVYWLIICQ